MKTKSLLFCLLFLVLGTSTALADKYYKVCYSTGYNYRATELETGKKYAIFNTAHSGSQDRTGFLYNDGDKLAVNQTRDQDVHIYNECFIFTLEKGEAEDQYYIKSLSSGTYVDVNGATTNVDNTNASLRINKWDVAIEGEEFDKDNGVWKGKGENGSLNKYKQSDCNSESANYTVIHTSEVTSGNRVFLISNDGYDWYWNGEVGSFTGYYDGHPFAFYEVEEVTSTDNLNLQDLHIYSRCDLYSAQQIYGYIKDASEQITLNTEVGDGAVKNLLDGDNSSFVATDWQNTATGHYFEINLDVAEGINSFTLYMQRRSDNKDVLTKFELQVLPKDGTEFISKGTFETTLGSEVDYSKLFTSAELGGTVFTKIRIVATETSAMAENMTCMGLAELYVLPDIDVINNAIKYMDNSLPVSATEAEYKRIIDEYNRCASAVKLLSGVPIPGNKYRIYADAYADGAYINRDVYTDGTQLLATGNYSAAADKSMYEWYCESTTDGYMVFRNVKNNNLFLGNAGVTGNIEEAKWSINTNLTQRHGVPLINKDGSEYLAVYNTGNGWKDDVKRVQNQTVNSGDLVIGTETVDGVETEIKFTVDNNSKGLCTDFVFLPVSVSGNEKRITIIASELAERNSVLEYDGQRYDMPFSRIMLDNAKLPSLTPTADKHNFDGFYLRRRDADGNEINIGTSITADIYDNTLITGDTLEARFTIEKPFEKTENSNDIRLYRIKNMRSGNIMQQVAPRKASGSIDIEDGEQISSSDAASYYASFSTKNSNISLIKADQALSATTFFYFTGGEINEQFYTTFIHSAVTVKKCKTASEWDDAGLIYYIQPNTTNGTDKKSGYAISRTLLNESNNPGDTWCSNHDNGDIVIDNSVENDGAAWEFEEVDEEEAKKELKVYIVAVAEEMYRGLAPLLDEETGEELCAQYGYDQNKALSYYHEITSLSADADNVSSLVAQAQALHMLRHEIDYGMQKLPNVTEKGETIEPGWYYVKNVYGGTYATYNGSHNNMLLKSKKADYSDMDLYNLFYFTGEKVVPGGKAMDEYLQVDVRSFMAYDIKNKIDSTLVGKNQVIFENVTFNGTGNDTDAPSISTIPANGAWEIVAEFESNGNSENHWGSCLLASGSDPKADNYANGFQVYLQTDGDLVIKAGAITNDQVVFSHIRGAYSKIKVVLSYADGKLKASVTNSQGSTKTIKETGYKENNVQVDYISCPNMTDITEFSTSLPVGVNITSLSAENVLAMKWNADDTSDEKDTWYILPSSNTAYKGLAIVMTGADDKNMGWTNVAGKNEAIFTDLGSFDYSTWQFEKVEEFDTHLQQLIEFYDIKDCAIYNNKYAELYNLIVSKSEVINNNEGTIEEELAFNDIYEAVKKYDGLSPDELKAPKPGKFYTIFPASDVEEVEMSVHVDKTAGEISTNEVNRTTKIRTYYKENEESSCHEEYISRGVWYFEGTEEEDGFLALEGLKFKNLHTQTLLNAFDANGALLTEEGELGVTLVKKGGAKVAIQANSSNMARGDVAAKSIITAATDRTFASDGVMITSSWHETDAVINSTITQESVSENVKLTVEGVNGVTAVLGSNYTVRTGEESNGHQLGYNIVCPDVNANSSDIKEKPIELTYTLTGLGEKFTFNHIALDIHAFNNSRKYQENADNKKRLWNVKAEVSNGEGEFTEFFTLTDIDIAAGVGEKGNVHQKWGLAGNEFTTTTGNLVVKLTITKGTENGGCFFGLSEVALSNVGDVWYIKEIEDPTKIYHETSIEDGYSTLMLGFNSTIPSGVEAHTANFHDKFISGYKYLSMNQVEGTELPAMQPVVLRNSTEGADITTKFYYNAGTKPMTDDGYMKGSLYFTVVEVPEGVNLYMLQQDKTGPKMYWIYEEYNEKGELVNGGNNDDGGHVLCKANKAYILIDNAEAKGQGLFLFNFKGGATGIEQSTEYRVQSTDIYDLQGRKLDEITRPGVYIVNGKKIIIK